MIPGFFSEPALAALETILGATPQVPGSTPGVVTLGIKLHHADQVAVFHQPRARKAFGLEWDNSQREDEQRIYVAIHDRVACSIKLQGAVHTCLRRT